MKNILSQNTATLLLVIGVICTLCFFISIIIDDYTIFGSSKIDFAVTGQVGDFIGGVIGTLLALSGTIFIYLSFKAQIEQNKRSTFENTFFHLLSIHTDNVNQISYSKYENDEIRTGQNRKVFKVINQEFLECYREIKRFFKAYKKLNADEIITPKYLNELKAIKNKKEIKFDIQDYVAIELAYNILYYGLGSDGDAILREKYLKKVKNEVFFRLLRYITLKPKEENRVAWEAWQRFYGLGLTKFHEACEEIYNYRKHRTDIDLISEDLRILLDEKIVKAITVGISTDSVIILDI